MPEDFNFHFTALSCTFQLDPNWILPSLSPK